MGLIYLFCGMVIVLGLMGAIGGLAERVREMMERRRPLEERQVLQLPNARFEPLRLEGTELPWPSEAQRRPGMFAPLPWPSEGWDDPAFGWKAREQAAAQARMAPPPVEAAAARSAEASPAPQKQKQKQKNKSKGQAPAPAKTAPASFADTIDAATAKALVEEHGLSGAVAEVSNKTGMSFQDAARLLAERLRGA
jgi:hypothetical protein